MKRKFKGKIFLQRGFSLIELLVTVAIVGLLASMAVAIFEEYRKRAYDVVAEAALHHMVLEVEKKIADYGDVRELNAYMVANGIGETDYKPKNSDWGATGQFIFSSYTMRDPSLVAVFDIGVSSYVIYTAHCNGTRGSSLPTYFSNVSGAAYDGLQDTGGGSFGTWMNFVCN